MSQAIYPVARGNEDPFAATHTPGPWEADTCGWPFVINAGPTGESPNIVALVYCREFTQSLARESQFPEDVAEANARLIAAAPDLLRALQRYIDWGESVPYGAPKDLLANACAAVKAATKE